ncbi:hypothetical protein E4U21_001019 [Claviceps maximensis]|nr:hypothetical protein E4U21_001019 [Claviceps maximensis]
MASTPIVDAIPPRSPPGLSVPSLTCVTSTQPPLQPECSPPAPSSSPRYRLRSPPPVSPSASIRRASRPENLAAVTLPPTTPVRRRRQNTACSHATPTSITTIDPPVLWGEDTIADHPSSVGDHITSQLGQDDDFLSAFADHEYSSPSTYPPFTANTSAGGTSPLDQAAFQPSHTTAASAVPPRFTPVCNRRSAAPSQPTTQLSSLTVEEPQFTLSSNEDWDELLSQISNGFFPDMMPLSHGQHTLSNETSNSSPNKRRPPPASDASPSNITMETSQGLLAPEDDLFGDSITPQAVDPSHDQDLMTIDLTEATDVPEDLKKPLVALKENNKIKISNFQCVICMDDASTLTVTHCGHLYCAQCLHSSLHVEATKNKCPMCRAKIDVKSRTAYSTKTKGFWPLELKLMTSTKKGKRKADDIS